MTNVLVITSEMDTVHLLQVKLGKEGYKVIPARTGDEGLDLARQEKPGVVILDPQVPGEHGIDIISHLKKDIEPAPVVIVLSSGAGIADISTAFAHGADDFVGQPFSPQGLLERIRVTLVRTGWSPAESEGA
jgi:DNA-binding response OmpR family regulator